MDQLSVIVALAAVSADKGDQRASDLLAGVELVIDRLAEEGYPSSGWVGEVRDFICMAREHVA